MRGTCNALVIVSALSLMVSCQGGGGSGGAVGATAGAGVQDDSGGDSGGDSGEGTVDAGGDADGGAVSLAWNDPTDSTDGSDLNDLAGFNVYFGTGSGDYSSVFDVGNSNEVDVVDLDAATYYFSVTAYDFFGNESGFSDEVVSTIE